MTTATEMITAEAAFPQFLLGTHHPGWLAHAGVPLFVSDTRLRRYKTLPVAAAPFGVDSGGFTELQQYGQWTVSPRTYVTRLQRYQNEIGRMLWAAPQDWMCEDLIINGGIGPGGIRFVGTHLSVAEHQRRTVLNFVALRELDPDLRIIPVVQGTDPDAYLRCVDLYWSLARIDLSEYPLVGVGSVCRLQATDTAGRILAALYRNGLRRLHGFGFKRLGLAAHGHWLTSADSLAWSMDARRLGEPLPGCSHKNCANCLRYALKWRAGLLTALDTASQAGQQTELLLEHENGGIR